MKYTHDLIVIGAGAAGLTAAGGVALFGRKVALVEAAEMGGECLNSGCVPSKALIAAAQRAHEAHTHNRFGVTLGEPQIDWAGVLAHVHDAIAAIAPHDSQARFEEMGVEVIRTHAHFTDPKTMLAGDRELRAPRIVIAAGSRPAIPPIDGLADIPFLTNENLFGLDRLPDHLVIVGAGAIGMEMAQAFRRLGSRVTLVQPGRPMARDDADAVQLLTGRLREEGVHFVDAKAERAAGRDGDVRLHLSNGETVAGSHLLIAAGRQANVGKLALDSAGVAVGGNGITVDARRRTSQKHIYAIGDCRDGPRFTHVSGYEGSNIVLEIALGLPTKVDWSALPHCTYTDPELAQIGLTESEARERHGDAIKIVRENFDHNDRAVAEGSDAGFLKLVMKGRKVLGVTIVGRHAGELLLPWAQIIGGKASTFAMGSAIVAYPTRSEISKAAAFAAWEPTVFGPWPKRWSAFVARLRGGPR